MDQVSLIEHKSLAVPEKRYGVREEDGKVKRPTVLGTGGAHTGHTSLLLSTSADGCAMKLWGVVTTGVVTAVFPPQKVDDSPSAVEKTLEEMWTFQTPSGTCNGDAVASYVSHMLVEKRKVYPDGHILILIDCPPIHDIEHNANLLKVISEDEERVNEYIGRKGGKKGGCILQYFKHNTTAKCQPNDDDKGINHMFKVLYRKGKANLTNSDQCPTMALPEDIVGELEICLQKKSRADRTHSLNPALDLRTILFLAAASYRKVSDYYT
tara:strand:- start:1291 stop:2091 length:801 start_codon:yes stop_codon:yes gene_type:complete